MVWRRFAAGLSNGATARCGCSDDATGKSSKSFRGNNVLPLVILGFLNYLFPAISTVRIPWIWFCHLDPPNVWLVEVQRVSDPLRHRIAGSDGNDATSARYLPLISPEWRRRRNVGNHIPP